MFDVNFLLSSWECIYGRGCQGVLTGPAPELEQGCCSYGAHFTDAADAARVRAASKTLTDEEWQYAKLGRRKGVVATEADGTRTTRIVDQACVFLNRPGFPAGAGCALHLAALRRGLKPLELKPEVCWQLPLRREDFTDSTGWVVSTIGPWGRRHWGEGGSEFHWWCTEAPEAFCAAKSVFESLRDELVAMVGARVYRRLASYLRERQSKSVPLPHPVTRRAKRSVRPTSA